MCKVQPRWNSRSPNTRRLKWRPLDVVEKVLESPEQVIPERGGMEVYQSRHDFGGMIFLVRVVVDRSVAPAMVVTVYRTTKIGKYWRKP